MRISKLGLLVLVSALLLLLLCSELKAAELHLELAKPNYDFSNYRVVIFSSDTGELIVNGTVASDAGNVRIPNMLPGTLFTVQIIAEFNNGTAAKFFKIFNTATVPEVPGGVRGQSETDNVLLEWEPPAIGQANTYIVNYGKSNDLEVGILGQVSLIKNATSPTRVDKLEPGSSYSFSIYAIFHNKSSQAATINVSTVPLPPESMGVLETTSSSALLSWRPPSVGSFDEFRLEYAGNLQLTGDLSMLIGDMMPGKMLTVSMATVSNGMLSDGVSYNVTARPLPVLNLQALALNTSAISLSWKVDMTSQQQYFVVTVANVVQQSKMDEQFKLQTIEHAAIVDRLPPGQQFTINVVAVSNNVSSDVSTALQATKPLQPIITALIPSADSFQLKWSPADGSTPSTSLSLLYGLVNNDLIYTREVSNAVSEVTVTGLTPGAVYQLNLTANSYGEKSEPLYKNISLVPLAPYDLHVPTANVTNSTMLVTWAFVDDDAAFINAFRVNVSSSSDGLEQTMVVTNTSRRSVIVRRLESGSEYKLSVESVAHNQYSDPITAVQATRPSTPRDMRLRFYTNTGLGVGWLAPYGNFDEYRVSYSGMDRNGNATLGKAAETFSFDNLTAGEEYVVSVSSYLNAFNLTSIPATIERRTRPLLESNFTQIEMSNTTVNVTVSPTKTGAFDYYIIRLVSFDTDKEKFLPRNASSLMVQFNKLSPGEPYEVTLAVKSGNIKSQDSRSLEFRTRPSDVELASVNSSVTEKSIALVWKPPDAGKYDMFDLQYRIVRGSRKFMNITTKQPSVQITNLKPFQSYEFALYVRSWQQRSEGISFKLKTKEGSPDAVQMFRISNTKATDITLNWEAPLNTNGIISGYTITYNGFSACNFTDYGRHEYAGGNVSYSPTVTGLMPATEYNVTIQAETTSRAGEKGYVVVKTKLAAPALQNRNAAPMPIQGSTTTKSFSVLLKRSWFSDCHGKITNFAIIVAQDPTYNSSGTNLLKWSQVKDTKLWKAYQATPINFNPFHYTDEFNFTIGVIAKIVT
ncbi:PREDICTED: tyrosine-protein phosphatase 10D-like [Priapulus caudatus]|uniref:Tyrosine-protein phosphatase 10D-like n=1 Tax=Priapulus caudatus TaxID=37621 RepID=A0ABM1EFU0_PRICU|nr:PREDICTED: tyrosine-protein phosphatase 10D-like [Priapulus caudatus]